MKVSRDQVAENRQAILEAASRLFRERGFDRVTVAAVMKAAGLTHGAFYGHFASKDDLVARACAHAVDPAARAAAGKPYPAGMRDFADVYLGTDHRDHPAEGCVFAALGTEAARASVETRAALTASIRRRIDTFADSAPDDTAEERRRAAIGGWSAMVGAVILARLVDDPALADELLAGTRAWLDRPTS
ncbi:MAG: helix-turn-helix domain containing protein [Azospirillaceae bacterium]|nr:helix-turn-helix domain containing protein [Azospirillaceae bacterium]